MSFTLPTAYSNATKQGNIQENWIVQLGFFNGDAQGKGDGGWDAVLQSGGAANLLNEALDDSETGVDVDDGTVFQVGDFIKVDSEIMKILSISTHTLTVERGAMSTTEATHNNNAAIYWNNFTPLALADTTIDDVFYHGVITNTPSVRSSIDLSKSTAKTGNVSLSVVNFQYKGDDFSAELFLGTRKYINRNVKIYSQLNGYSTLANCLQVYQGRLIDISHDDASIKLTLTEQRPWDFISIPQTKTTTSKKYFPIVYGAFTPETSTVSSPDNCRDGYVFPSPVDVIRDNEIIALVHDDITSAGDARLHFIESNALDDGNIVTVPLDDVNNNGFSYEGGYANKTNFDLDRSFKVRPLSVNASNDYALLSDSGANMIDSNTSSKSELVAGDFTITANGTSAGGNDTLIFKFNIPQFEHELTAFTVTAKIKFTITTEYIVAGTAFLGFTAFDYTADAGNTLNDTNTSTSTAGLQTLSITNTSATEYSSNIFSDLDGQTPNMIDIRTSINATASDFGGGGRLNSLSVDVELYDLYITPRLKIPVADADTAKHIAANQALDKIEYLYCGTDGLDNSFTGGSGVADTGLEAHRDLLTRFSGFDDSDGDIYNYDANLDIEAARITTAWNIRWWALEPMELKKVLEQIQYEFCFIFKWRNGLGSYWYVKDSYSSGDVAQTLKKDDIFALKINNTPFSELLTDMRINYEKHPSEDSRYLSSQTSKDTTNNQRTIWNIQAKENISEINLNMNVNKPGNTNPGGGNPNDGFADYYMNIFGDIKKIVTCDIVNPAVGYNLETGDIIQFSNTAGEMPVEPFGDNWADYYMITDLQRSPGRVKIQAREVG